MAGTLTPTPFQTVLDTDGVAVSGALIYTYVGGTTTNAATYTTSALTVANANPIVADAAGRFVAYLPAGGNFKFLYKTAAGATIEEQDNILSVPGAAVNLDIEGTVGEAVTAGQVCYLSSGAEATPLTPGLWYLTDADAAATSTLPQSVGIAVSAIAINTAGTIRLAGTATTASAVVVGSTYYASATAGALTATAPALPRQVGVALTTSTLLLSATTAVSVLPNPINQDVLFVDATYDIGKAGANRPRDFFQSRNATIGGTLGVTGATTLSSTVGTGALAVTGTATVSSTLVVTGATTLSTLGVTGVTTLTGGLNTALTVPNGGTGVATQQAYGVLVGGTTATGAMQSITPGASTKVLTSAGTGALPAWSQPSNLTQSFRSLTLRTSPDANLAAANVFLNHADEIVMQDGVSVSDWDDLTANIAVSGAGGLDTGSEGASRWYSIHAIRKSSDGTKGLLLHRAKDYGLDQSLTATYDANSTVRSAAGSQQRGQTFQAGVTGPMPFFDVQVQKVGAPTGYFTLTLYATSAGLPTGAALATSRVQDVSLLSASGYSYIRFIFDAPYSVTSGVTYAAVLSGTFTIDGANYIQVAADASSPGYASGSLVNYDGATWTAVTGTDWLFKTYVTQNDTALTLPSGYDQYAQVGWVFNNASSNFNEFLQVERYVRTRYLSISTALTNAFSTLMDLSTQLPPVPCVFANAQVTVDGVNKIVQIHPVAGSSLAVYTYTQPVSGQYLDVSPGILVEFQHTYMLVSSGNTGGVYLNGFRW